MSKIALFGGTGFVGSYIADCLIANNYSPQVLVRKGSEQKIIKGCNIISGDISDLKAIEKTILGTDAIIFNVGIIRENLSLGITFNKLHFESVIRCIELAKKLNVNRFILMSANGVKKNGTNYQVTKFIADEYLQKTELVWTIFRPSLIFGDPRGSGRPEFCSQLKKDMLSLPFPAPLFYNGFSPFKAGRFSMSPIHVENVAEFFIKSINNKDTFNKIYNLGGKYELNWKEIIHTIAIASKKKTWKIPAPVFFIKLIALFLDRFQWFPITKEQLEMLLEGNVVKKDFFNEFGISPKDFNLNNLKYLSN